VIKRIVVLGAVVAVIGVGLMAFSFFKPPKEASGPIEAISVAVVSSASDDAAQVPDTEAAAPAGRIETSESTSAKSETDGPAATEPAAEGVTATEPAPDAKANPVTFEIVPSSSEVRFIIEEVLNGAPKTVVGTTDQIAGEIAIYADDPARSVVGPILVNARTLATDNEFRNRAIKNRILSTNDYEFITFTPTSLVGMPDSVSVGESIAFQIIGDLTVRDVTKEVTFDAVVTPISEAQLEGTASTAILYADYGLVIPEAPAVAGVNDDVKLEIVFLATAK